MANTQNANVNPLPQNNDTVIDPTKDFSEKIDKLGNKAIEKRFLPELLEKIAKKLDSAEGKTYLHSSNGTIFAQKCAQTQLGQALLRSEKFAHSDAGIILSNKIKALTPVKKQGQDRQITVAKQQRQGSQPNWRTSLQQPQQQYATQRQPAFGLKNCGYSNVGSSPQNFTGHIAYNKQNNSGPVLF